MVSQPTGHSDSQRLAAATAAGAPAFVIQQREASVSDVDLRLDVDGVLRTWMVPKGISIDPGDKQLAVETGSQPTDFADFEGVIPEGRDGAGALLVWDTGTYENATERDGQPVPVAQALAEGRLLIRLHGTKIRGGFALQRIHSDEAEAWLLLKANDEHAGQGRSPLSEQPESALTGRTLDEIKKDGGLF